MTDAPAGEPAGRFRRTPRRAERLLPDRAVVQLVDRPAVLELEGTAFCLWLALDGEPTLAEIVADLAAAFGSEPSEVEADVAGVLDSMVGAGFVECR